MNCTSLSSIRLPPLITTVNDQTFRNCTSLISIHLPEDLTVISVNALQGCSNLSTIKTPFCSPTIFANDNIAGFKSMFDLFSNNNQYFGFKTILDDFNDWPISPHATDFSHHPRYQILIMIHKCKLWARARGRDGRLPLVRAATKSLKWSHMSLVFNAYMPGINEIDMLTGLPVFVLAAAGPNSDIESVYNLLREYPSAMSFIDISITSSPRKRVEYHSLRQ